jgi:hypothetical protein
VFRDELQFVGGDAGRRDVVGRVVVSSVIFTGVIFTGIASGVCGPGGLPHRGVL